MAQKIWKMEIDKRERKDYERVKMEVWKKKRNDGNRKREMKERKERKHTRKDKEKMKEWGEMREKNLRVVKKEIVLRKKSYGTKK